MDARVQIQILHGLYGELTGHRLVLNAALEYDWFEWLRYRRGQPFNAEDLRCVVAWLKREIKTGERKPAALLFRNLIRDASRFDEDLSAARAAARNKPPPPRRVQTPAPGGVTERQLPGDGTEHTARTAADVLASKEFQELVNFKKSLKP